MRIFSVALVALSVAMATSQFVPSELVNQAKQCLQDNNGDKTKAVECVAKILGGDVQALKAKVEALFNGGDQKVIDFLKSKAEQIHQYLESKQGFFDKIHDKAHELKDKVSGFFGQREKRLAPTQTEVQLAKQIKICIDMGQDKASCIEKVLNGKHADIDLVKLDTIVKYEDVLKELKEFFAFKEQGGTLKEFIEFKKQQSRQKRAMPQSVETLLVFKYIIDQCQAKTGKSAISCSAMLFGPTLDSLKEKIDNLVNSADPRIVEIVKSAYDQLHQYYESASGVVDKAKDKVQTWWKDTFGRRKRDLPTQAEVQLAKQVKICIDMGTDKATCIEKALNGKNTNIDLVKLDTIVKYEDVLKELKEFFAFKEQGGTLKEFIAYKKQQNRQKRDMPTQAEVQLAKQIKICIDMGQDKASCIEKVLNGKHADIDLVKLDTIVKYEDVLAELKEYFAYKEQGGTLKEFNEMKKQQLKAKNRLSIPSVQTLLSIKNIVTECLAALPNKDVVKCATSLFGPEATAVKGAIEELIKTTDPKVIEFAKGKGKELQTFLDNHPGYLGKIYDVAHDVYSWVENLVG